MLKHLLVPIDGSDNCLKAVEYAADIARGKNIQIFGLAPINEKGIPSPAIEKENEAKSIPPHIHEQVRRSTEEFKLWMAERGIPKEQYQVKTVVGNPFYRIVREAVFNDIIIIGSHCHFPPQTEKDESLDNLLYRSSRPVLFVPYTEHEFQSIRNVVIGVDGTAPSSRLIYLYLLLNPFPGAKVYLVHTKREADDYHLEEFFEKIEQMFKEVAFDTESCIFDTSYEEALLTAAAQKNADAICFGIPEKRSQEGTTFDHKLARNIMRHALPVLTLR